MSNETSETRILTRLKDFYQSKFPNDKQISDDKFSDSVLDLVKNKDIKISSYYKFCADNDIESREVEIKSNNNNNNNNNNYDNYNDGGCNSFGGGSYNSGNCR